VTPNPANSLTVLNPHLFFMQQLSREGSNVKRTLKDKKTKD